VQLIGYIDAMARNRVTGWIANKLMPNEPVTVLIHVNGERVGRAVAENYREDLHDLFPNATGRYSFTYTFAPPLSMFADQDIKVTVGNVLPSRGFARLLPAIAQETTPLLITSAGRSGSTLIMNRLHAHPEIVLMNNHPAEVKQLTYYAQALRTLVSPADREHSTDPDLMADDPFHIGFNPFNDPGLFRSPIVDNYWNRTVPSMLGRSFRDLIITYYDALRMAYGKTAMRYFAEKAQPDPVVRQATSLMFGSLREIVLLRDPRDLICSYNAFWGVTMEEARNTLRSQLNLLLQLRGKQPSHVHFVKYEDLALHGEAIMRGIFGFLGLNHVADAEVNDPEVFKKHGTSRSPAASIGRWRSDLSAEEIAACNEGFEDFLRVFDYRLS